MRRAQRRWRRREGAGRWHLQCQRRQTWRETCSSPPTLPACPVLCTARDAALCGSLLLSFISPSSARCILTYISASHHRVLVVLFLALHCSPRCVDPPAHHSRFIHSSVDLPSFAQLAALSAHPHRLQHFDRLSPHVESQLRDQRSSHLHHRRSSHAVAFSRLPRSLSRLPRSDLLLAMEMAELTDPQLAQQSIERFQCVPLIHPKHGRPIAHLSSSISLGNCVDRSPRRSRVSPALRCRRACREALSVSADRPARTRSAGRTSCGTSDQRLHRRLRTGRSTAAAAARAPPTAALTVAHSHLLFPHLVQTAASTWPRPSTPSSSHSPSSLRPEGRSLSADHPLALPSAVHPSTSS